MKTPYNQNLDNLSKMWCSLYWIYHIMYFKFWIEVSNNFILSSLLLFEKLWVRSRTTWASFDKIYKSFEKEINNKLWINIKIVTKTVNEINNTWAYGIWFPNYKNFKKYITDWSFDIDDIKNFLSWWVWHHLVRKGWYLINSNWDVPIKCSLDTLKEMVKQWIIWNNFRTIEHWTEATRNILQLCLMMQKANLQWKLKEYLETNKDNVYLKKAKELFEYGK